MDILSNLLLGLETAIAPENLFYCFIGVFLGTFIGVLPGIGPLAAISMLFPLTFYLDPTPALIMLAGIWYGTSYGGSTASILLNLPGTTSSAVTCLDGYPMAQQGRGGIALFMTTVASFVGGSIGILLLIVFGPAIAAYALKFGPWEYFSLILLGLVAASAISSGPAIMSLAMVTLGVIFGTVGLDIYSGLGRYTFGILELRDGITLVALAMGLFGVSEIISSVGHSSGPQIDKASTTFKSMVPARDDVKRSVGPILRGAGIGSFMGALPGAGPSIAAFMSYAVEKRISKHPQRFGNGAIEGVVAPESANNAADQTAFIPTLALGIPGSATMALMIGALMVHGITPGPTFVVDHADIFWGLVMSFWIGNLLLVILNIPLIGLWVKVLLVPYHILFPSVLVFIAIGAFAVNGSGFDVALVLFFGALGFVMRIFQWPAAPVLLGFVLGPMMEEHFRRAMLISRGNMSVFFERPISAVLLVLSLLLLAWGIWSSVKESRRVQDSASGPPDTTAV